MPSLDATTPQRWSLQTGVLVGFAVGGFAACAQAVMFRVAPPTLGFLLLLAPLLMAATGSALVIFLYAQVPRSRFRFDAKGVTGGFAASGLVALALAGSVWCYRHHIGHSGHMASGPYPGWHYFIDFSWGLALPLSAVWAWRIRNIMSIGFAMLTTYLLVWRFLFESLGGYYIDFPL